MPTLRINTGLPRVIFEPLFGGGYVPPTQSNVICVLIANELYIDSGRLAFHTLVKIPKTETENEADAKALAIGCVESELPLTLSKHGYWDFYRTTELNLPSRDCRVTKPRLGQVEVALELHEGIHRQATDTLSHLIGLEQRFEQAKKRLWELPFGLRAVTSGSARTSEIHREGA